MLKIVGDINLSDGFFDTGFGVGSLIRKGANPFDSLDIKKEDFWIGNFECVCATSSNKKGIEKHQFRVTPQDLNNINHFDLYGVANNHVMQHGNVAFNEMLHYFESKNIAYVGSLNKKHTVVIHQNKKIGILAFSQRPENFSDSPLYWALPEYYDLQKELEKLSSCDFRIVYVHWGNEFINFPYIDQKNLARYLIDCGADLVVGMHPHVLQGFEVYKNKYIFYSLGNFVFNMRWHPTKYSAIISVDFSKNDTSVSYDYVLLDNCFPKDIKTKNVNIKYRFESLNKLVNKNIENERYYSEVFLKRNKYRKSNYIDIMANLCKFKIKNLFTILLHFIKRKINKR